MDSSGNYDYVSKFLRYVSIVLVCPMLAQCNRAPTPTNPDQLHWHSKNLHLVVAINGIPTKVELGHASDDGFKEIADFEKPGVNSLEVIAIPIVDAKPASAHIRIHAYHDEKKQAADIPVEIPISGGEQRFSAKFSPIGSTHWQLSAAEPIGVLSAEDNTIILSEAEKTMLAFQRRDTTVVKGGEEVFKRFPQTDAQTIGDIQIIPFERGVFVLTKNFQPIIRMYNAAAPNDGEFKLTWLAFFKIDGKWNCRSSIWCSRR